MTRILICVLAASLVATPAAVAKKPSSFAQWIAKWKAQHDPAFDKASADCARRFPHDDAKLGACLAKGDGAVLGAQAPEWERQVTRIERDQTAPCKKAIRVYRLTWRRRIHAELSYVASHQHVTKAAFESHFREHAYLVLVEASLAAKTHAIRVCG